MASQRIFKVFIMFLMIMAFSFRVSDVKANDSRKVGVSVDVGDSVAITSFVFLIDYSFEEGTSPIKISTSVIAISENRSLKYYQRLENSKARLYRTRKNTLVNKHLLSYAELGYSMSK